MLHEFLCKRYHVEFSLWRINHAFCISLHLSKSFLYKSITRVHLANVTHCQMLLPYDGSLETPPLKQAKLTIEIQNYRACCKHKNMYLRNCRWLLYLNPGKKFLCLKYELSFVQFEVLFNICLEYVSEMQGYLDMTEQQQEFIGSLCHGFTL